MLKSRRNEIAVAAVLIAPFVAVYAWLFIYPTVQMVYLTFTNAPLIGAGEWTGWHNYERLLFTDRTFYRAIWNTAYFVLLTVVPGTLVAMIIALMVHRLSGWLQSAILAAFFLPFILPVSVVYLIWQWIFDPSFGIAQHLFRAVHGDAIPVFRRTEWFLPMVGLVTVWWTNGFSILLFLAGLKGISPEIYESASLDGATRWQQFYRITWPLIWPVTALVLTIQLILQLKIFDQVYLFSVGGRTAPTMVLLQYVYEQAFVHNRGGYGATVALALFLIIVVFSILQFQVLRIRGEK